MFCEKFRRRKNEIARSLVCGRTFFNSNVCAFFCSLICYITIYSAILCVCVL